MPMSIEKRYTADEFYKLDIAEPCELINGRIINMSPSPSIIHQNISGEIFYTIKDYIKKHGGKCSVFEAPTDVKLNDDTVVIPDIFVACDPTRFDEQKYNGAPDWIIEIVSTGSSERDYRDKLMLYKNAGVKEYWIVDPSDKKVIVYLYGKSNIINFYDFDDEITADIYKGSAEPLKICIGAII